MEAVVEPAPPSKELVARIALAVLLVGVAALDRPQLSIRVAMAFK